MPKRTYNNQHRFWKTISFRLIFSFLTVSLIPLAVVVILNVRSSHDALVDQAYRSLKAHAAYASLRIESFIRANLNVIGTEALLPVWSEFLHSHDLKDLQDNMVRTRTLQTLQSLQQKNPVFISSYALIDINGYEVMNTDVSMSGRSLKEREYFKQALETGLPYVSDVMFDKAGDAFFYFSCPVLSPDGSMVGVLRSKYSAAVLQQLTIQSTGMFNQHSFAMLVNTHKLIIGYGVMSFGSANAILFHTYAPLPPERLDPLINEQYLPSDYAPKTSFSFLEIERGLVEIDSPSPFFSSKLPGTGDSIFTASAARINNSPWLVMSFQPRESFSRIALTQVRQALMLAAFVAVIVIISALYWAYWLSRPIRELTTVAEQISDGDLSATSSIDLSGTNDISILAKALNVMTYRLRRKIEAEAVISFAARKLIASSGTDFDGSIRETLKHIGLFGGLDRHSLWIFTDDDHLQLQQSHSWGQPEPVGSASELINIAECHELIRVYTDDKPFLLEDINTAGITVKTKNLWQQRHTSASACCVVASGNRIQGMVVMELIDKVRNWSDTDIQLLQMTAEIISHALERQRLEEENRKNEQQLQHSAKMEAVGTLAGGIAHDFNNLLQGISGYLQLLMIKRKPEDDDYEFLSKAYDAVLRAAELVQRLLAFSRKAHVSLQPIDVNKVIDTTLHLLNRTIPKMVTINTDLAANLQPAMADPTQLEQVLVNLANNAVDAMNGSGTLTFSSAVILPDDSGQASTVPGGCVSITVTDTGEGMNEQTRQRIFEPFFTTKAPGKGTGLGLSSVYAILKQHKGTIHCKSSPGNGTSFTICLPLAQSAKSDAIDNTAQVLPTGSESILLVDDETDILHFASAFLNDLGYRVEQADSAEQALELLATEGSHFDLVIMDLGMPGIGGEKGLEQLKNQYTDLKVLIASGYAGHPIAKDPQMYGAVDFIAKPYRLEILARQIRSLLDSV